MLPRADNELIARDLVTSINCLETLDTNPNE
jgi:hypothetical protein